MPSLRPVVYALAGLIGLVTLATNWYVHFEDLNWLDSVWLALVSITTVGYGDVVPQTAAGRYMTMILIVSGVGLFTYALSGILVYVTEGHLRNVWGLRKMQQELKRMAGHVVVCGAGRVGQEAIKQLRKDGVQVVAIESDLEKVARLKEIGIIALHGDATDDDLLRQAGVERARGLIACLPNDAANLLVTLSCKGLNPSCRVVARANRPEVAAKLTQVGADSVVSPAIIGGSRMALSVVKPASVAFVETLVDLGKSDLEIEELSVAPGSPLAGRTLRDSRIREDFSSNILAIKRGEEIMLNLTPDQSIQAGDLLIVFGQKDNLARLEAYVNAGNL